MCGRINLLMSPGELAAIFELFREPEWAPRYNMGPLQPILAVRQTPAGRAADRVQWGLVPSWATDPKVGSQMFNARAETVATKPAFRSSFRRRRCLVPASGFYEWQVLDRKTRQPWNIFRADGQPLALAGLWERWTAPDGSVLESCTVITTTPNAFMAELHDRMPVILDPSVWDLWLTPDEIAPEALLELLVPCPDDWLQRFPVSTLVGNIRNESPECLKPITIPGRLF